MQGRAVPQRNAEYGTDRFTPTNELSYANFRRPRSKPNVGRAVAAPTPESSSRHLYSNSNQVQFRWPSFSFSIQLRKVPMAGYVRIVVLLDRKVHTFNILVSLQLFVSLKQDSLPDVDVPGCSVEQ